MKIENTPEEKARFFALYWGAGYVLDNGIKSNISVSAFMSEMIRGKSHLELTPLSQISDEDAIEVAKIIEPYTGFSDLWTPLMGMKWAIQISKGIAVPNARPAIDFLRPRGYYVGDGTEVEYGWAVLKGGEHEG